MKSKTVVIACMATLALLAVAFLGSGSLLGSSLGMAGQKAIDGVIGFIAYPNRSDSVETAQPADAGAERSARLAAAKARSAGDTDNDAMAPSGAGMAMSVINAATEAANNANGGSVALAAREGQAPPEIVTGAEISAQTEPATSEASEEMQVAMASSDDNVTLERDDSPATGEEFAPPSAMPSTTPSADDAGTPREEDAFGAADAANDYAEDGDEDWESSDPFEFEDESILREMGPGYTAFDGRDPFLALVTVTDQSSAAGTIIDPDGMRFVGIIWGSNGICALVEDRERRGYVVREGDRVMYGRVSSISRDAIVIDQVIHGEFKRLTLRLEPTRMEGN
ncbi:MAG: hypothetical protein ACKVU1_00220 [bacterium]